MINGNVQGVVRYVKNETVSDYGEKISVYENYKTLTGFLDYSQGSTDINTYSQKCENNTYYFICEYMDLSALKGKNCSMVINGEIYDIIHIDNPMELNSHLEIEIKKTGAVIYG